MLNTKLNFARPDEIYAKLIAAHDGLTEPESHAMNARLVLLLLNHVGDQKTIEDAFLIARGHEQTKKVVV